MIRDPGRGGTLAKVRETMIFVLDLGISSVVISGPLGVGPRRTSADLGGPRPGDFAELHPHPDTGE